MSTTAWIAAGVAAYFLFFNQPRTQTSAAALAAQPVASVSGGATRIAIPGFGEYINVGGGQTVSLTLDPNLFANLFGEAA